MLRNYSSKIYYKQEGNYPKSSFSRPDTKKWISKNNYKGFNDIVDSVSNSIKLIMTKTHGRKTGNNPGIEYYINWGDALSFFVLNYFYNVPMEAINHKLTLNDINDYLMLIAKNPSSSATVISFIVDLNQAAKENKIYISTRSSYIGPSKYFTILTNIKETLKNNDKLYYSPFDDIHQKSCSLSFYQQMKIRLKNLEKCEYYYLCEQSKESEIEKIFIELFNIKTIDIEHECL